MKFAVAFAAIVAVAVASPYQKPIDTGLEELEAIVAAIQSPSTDPATASLLEQQLADLLADLHPQPEPIFVEEPAPIFIGPAIIDFPLPDGGDLTPGLAPVVPETPAIVEAPVAPAPVVVGGNAESSPLVQIIVNVQASSAASPAPVPSPVAPAPVETPVLPVDPVIVVEEAVNEETVVPTPVVVAPEPVVVVEAPAEPIQIGSPIMPGPVVLLPETLN